ncbi:hypothetical protein BOX15_Mlig018401g1, partial [Macrostomum lignano]
RTRKITLNERSYFIFAQKSKYQLQEMYAGLSYKKQYLLQITDASLKMFSDTRVKAACNRTSCVFAVKNKILTRKLGGTQAMRFCIFEIKGRASSA